jgi:hypothetical protein
VRGIQSDHDDLVARNKSIAEYNLSLQPKLDSLKTEVATLYETVNKLKMELGVEKAKLGKNKFIISGVWITTCQPTKSVNASRIQDWQVQFIQNPLTSNNNNNNNTGCYIRAFPKELKARRSIPT